LRQSRLQLRAEGKLPIALTAPAQLQEQSAQPLELLVLGMQRSQVGVGRIAGGDVRENVLGWAHGRRVIQQL
jgi:hypothetical protein